MEVKADDDDNPPEFFKVYISHHGSHKNVNSKRVCRIYASEGPAELACSSGQTWQVELVQDGKDMYFSESWQAFVDDKMVRDGDFLFFKFRGNLMFSVVIYDESMCEKRVTFVDEGCQGRDDVQKAGQGEAGAKPVKSRGVGCSKPKGSLFPLEDKTEEENPISVKPLFEKYILISNLKRGCYLPSSFVREYSLRYKSYEKADGVSQGRLRRIN